MPALTHGRVINGFNAYPLNYKKKTIKYYNKSSPYSCNNTHKNCNSNKSASQCSKIIYVPNGTIVPQKYIKSNSCTSQKCRRVLYNTKSKYGISKSKYNISQRGIGDTVRKNILNKKNINECILYNKLKKQIKETD